MTALHIAGPDDLERVMPMVTAYHEHEGIARTDDERRSALEPLLEGSPHGVVYLIGPRRSPVGYIVICFGWSLELGGIDGFIDEFWIRAAVRGRGMGTEVLSSLAPALAKHGVKALHLEVDRTNDRAQALYRRNHFELREKFCLMTRAL